MFTHFLGNMYDAKLICIFTFAKSMIFIFLHNSFTWSDNMNPKSVLLRNVIDDCGSQAFVRVIKVRTR